MPIRLRYPLLAAAAFLAVPALADPLTCDLGAYNPAAGLDARMDGDGLMVSWDGDPGQRARMRLAVKDGTPTIRDLSLQEKGAAWASVISDAMPEFSVVSGVRRMSQQQLTPLKDRKIPITQAELAKHRWDPFWDAPLDLSTKPNPNRANPPPVGGIPGTDQAGLPRDPTEVKRADASYAVRGCSVRTDGGRIEISFPGVTLGVFNGKLMYTVYRGTNLIRQEIVATTQRTWVAYKYDAGLRGLTLGDSSQVAWRDTGGTWQRNRLGGAAGADRVPLKAANRLAVAQQGPAGSIAAFPPPHKFFWAREVAINMGYNWYRRDGDDRFAFGIRQNEKEDESENPANWALYSARPGTEQLMPVYLYPTLGGVSGTAARVMALTHGDTYKPLPGYKVMNHHYHMDAGERWQKEGIATKLPDLEVLKGLGLDIVSPIWSIFMTGFDGADPRTVEADALAAAASKPPRGDYIAIQATQIEGARLHSDRDFLIMPDVEIYGGPLGGHTDLLYSHPVLWNQRRPGQPFTENDPRRGKVYHIGSAKELMDMARAEDIMISMPHPRTKGSAGYPDAVKDRDYFNDPHYVGFGFRWGMGLDGSERRTCEYRCLPLLDDLSNWTVDRDEPLKYVNSISEARFQAPGDDVYASAPVTYVKLAEQPRDPAPVVAALMRGDSFVTTGEVLIPSYQVIDAGKASRIVADVEWTFPLDMVEIVWGDGRRTGRKVIPTTDLPPMGSHRFDIPFDATGKKWIRFAAWDSASEGAFTQPRRLNQRPIGRRAF